MQHYLKLFFQMVAPFAVLLLLIWLLPKLLWFFLPFVMAYAVAFVANPLVLFLQRRLQIKRKYASALITVVVLLLVCLILYLGISSLITAVVHVVQTLPHYYEELLRTFDSLSIQYADVIDRLPQDLIDAITNFRTNLNRSLTELFSKIADPTLSVSLSAVRSVPSVFINALIFLLSAFCFIREWEMIQLWIRNHTPRMIADYLQHLRADLKKIFGSWLLAQFKIMFVVFAVLAAAFLLLRVDYAVPIALLTAVLDFLPALGVGFIMWPWIVLSLLQGEFTKALWLTVVYILTQAVRNTLQPKIMGDTMGLPMLWTLFFLYVGFKLYGIAGMIFAVPVGMFLLSLVRYGVFDGAVKAAKELMGLIFGV